MQLFVYILRRLLTVAVQVASILLAIFFLIRMLPADPVARLVGSFATPEIYAHTKAALHLDKPLLTQLAIYLGLFPRAVGPGLLQGDLGRSWVTSSPVSQEIWQFLPITLELITLSFVVACVLAIPMGILAALKPNGLLDRGVFSFSLFAGAQPDFWWGLIFIYFFYFVWRLAPAPLGHLAPLTVAPPVVTGFPLLDALLTGRPDVSLEALHHLMLPVVTMAFIVSGPIVKMVRQNVIRALQSNYILYARACGLSQFHIAAYTFRNAFAPTLTIIAVLYGYMWGGAVLVEQVFSLGGLGQYALRSILAFDYPAIQGVVLTITIGSLLIYLAMDILHSVADPRIVNSR